MGIMAPIGFIVLKWGVIRHGPVAILRQNEPNQNEPK